MREAHAASGGRLRHLWADSADRGLLAFAWVFFDLTVEVVTRREGAVGFEVIPRRWVLERTCGWLVKYRRLGKDHEFMTESSEAIDLRRHDAPDAHLAPPGRRI